MQALRPLAREPATTQTSIRAHTVWDAAKPGAGKARAFCGSAQLADCMDASSGMRNDEQPTKR
eukprot:1928943-Alexandrium_andersonii.AAC.1